MSNNPAETFSTPERASYPALLALDRCIDHLSSIAGVARAPLQEWRAKLSAQIFNLLVVGQFKRGKTSVINALIGAELLPVGVIPLTSVVTILSYGDSISIQVIYNNGRRERIEPGSLVDYVTEKGNPHNSRGIHEVLIDYPSPWLQGGLRLVDTPGIGSVHRHNTDITYGFLPKADAVLFVLSVDQPISQEEYNFLKELGKYASKIFVLVNKIDVLTEADLDESITFIRKTITDAIDSGLNLFPISARQALQGYRSDLSEAPPHSGFPAFSKALESFLLQEKTQVLATSVARGLSRMLSQIHARTEIELKSLDTPIVELQQKILVFEAKKEEILQVRNDHVLLLEGESRHLLERTIDGQDGTFEAGLVQHLDTEVEHVYQESHALSARALQEALRQRVATEIRQAYDVRVQQEEEAVAQAFRALCTRFSAKLNELVDDLFRFSSELFSIHFDAIQVESSWEIESRFSYKFWQESAGLTILISSFMLALPKPISGPWLLKSVRRYLREHVESHEGRMRYDLAQRLDRSVREFLVVLLERIDTTIAATEQAVKKGLELRQTGEQKIADARRDLSNTLDALNGIRAELAGAFKSVVVTP